MSSKSRNSRQPRRHVFESLENRQLMAADLGLPDDFADGNVAAETAGAVLPIDVHALNNVRNMFGAETTQGPAAGDWTLDQRVDIDDMNFVRSNFGRAAQFTSREQTEGFNIIGGAKTNDFPSVGAVQRVGDQLNTKNVNWGHCTGTLISRYHVLTAAHCVWNDGTTWMQNDRDGQFEVGGQRYRTKDIYVHPEWNGDVSDGDDVAILELDRRVEGVTPSPLYRKAPVEGTSVTIVGYGYDGTCKKGDIKAEGGGKKRFGTITIDDVTKDRFEWKYDCKESNTARGDSGGPGFIEEDGRLYVAGITSSGTGNAEKGTMSYDMRVDAYTTWINDIVWPFGPKYFVDTHTIGGEGETPLVGDFNADGFDDIGVYIPNGTQDARWVVKLNDRAGGFKSGYYIDTRTIGGEGETPLVGDFNADGYDDIGVYIPNGAQDARWVVKQNDREGGFKSGYYIDTRTIGGAGEVPLVGDFNEDAYDDIGVYIPNGPVDARWVVKLNDHDADFTSRYYTDARNIGGEGETPLVGDFNGEGRDDIGVYIPNGTRDARWVMKLNGLGDNNPNLARAASPPVELTSSNSETGARKVRCNELILQIDRNLVRQWFGAEGPGLLADINRDGRVDIADYLEAREHRRCLLEPVLPRPLPIVMPGCPVNIEWDSITRIDPQSHFEAVDQVFATLADAAKPKARR